jgi:hypothetical protein
LRGFFFVVAAIAEAIIQGWWQFADYSAKLGCIAAIKDWLFIWERGFRKLLAAVQPKNCVF